MRTQETFHQYRGQDLLAIAGWTAISTPQHRALEAEAMEQIDIAERDYAARVTFMRRSAR